MTNEHVDNLEAALREAQDKVEEAGRLLCNERGNVAPWMWGDCNRLSGNIAELIHQCWKLRPDEPDEPDEPMEETNERDNQH